MISRLSKLNTFQKITILVFSLLIPTILLYSYSNYVSEEIVKQEIHTRNLDRLSVSLNQLESSIEQLSMFLVAMSMDSDIHKLRNLNIYNDFEKIQIKRQVKEKVYLHWGMSDWSNELMIYIPNHETAIGTSNPIDFPSTLFHQWKYTEVVNDNNEPMEYFVRHFVYPMFDPTTAIDLIIEAKIPVSNIEKHFYRLIEDGDNDPFLFHEVHGAIYHPTTSNGDLINQLLPYLKDQLTEEQGNITIPFKDEMYLVSYVKSNVIDWVMIDYVPLKKVLSPITFTRNLFFVSVTSLLLMGLFASLILYRNVHLPIKKLSDGIVRFQEGDYSIRINPFKYNEFNALTSSFNNMANQIQQLIEKVYEERIRTNEANLKQLQAQIDPHFLYNCLFYIKNMAKVNNTNAVQAMSLHLGEYYRYMTRLDNMNVTVRDELKLVDNYLSIYVLRTQRFEYNIDVPEYLLDCEIPRLLIQPIVENAIIHGLEPKTGIGKIDIYGYHKNGINKLIIEDNGLGVTNQQLDKMRHDIQLPMTKDMGCGVWNVHQRLVHQFQGQSGLQFDHSSTGGLRVEIMWEAIVKRYVL